MKITPSRLWALSLSAVAVTAFSTAWAAEFGVSPIRIEMDRMARTAVVTVTNDGDAPLRVQMNLVRWTQNTASPNGEDVYTDSDDLQFYPRLMVIEPKERRVIRIGTKGPATVPEERTYRLFIREVLDPLPKEAGARVRIAFRFALPIFIQAAMPQARAEIAALSVDKGTLKFTIRNSGTEQFRIEKAVARFDNGNEKENAGWYLLPGIAREHTLAFDGANCKGSKKVDLHIKTDKLTLDKSLPLPADACPAAP